MIGLKPHNLEKRNIFLDNYINTILGQEVWSDDLFIDSLMCQFDPNRVKLKMIDGNIYIACLSLKKLPIWFSKIELVTRDFDCSWPWLMTLKNLPLQIEGNLYYSYLAADDYITKTIPKTTKIRGKIINKSRQ